MRVLLHVGASVNRPDQEGYSPLGASVWAGGGPATRLLLAARADVDGGHPSPLTLAMQREDRECAQLLVEAGASRAPMLGVAEPPPTLGVVIPPTQLVPR